jgi:hypothetical protein
MPTKVMIGGTWVVLTNDRADWRVSFDAAIEVAVKVTTYRWHQATPPIVVATSYLAMSPSTSTLKHQQVAKMTVDYVTHGRRYLAYEAAANIVGVPWTSDGSCAPCKDRRD